MLLFSGSLAVILPALIFVVSEASDRLVPRGVQGTDTDEAEGVRFLLRYDERASVICNEFMEASWQYNTNITEFNRRNMIDKQLKWSEFHKASFEEGRQFAWKSFSHATVRRMFSYITVLGRSALPDHKLTEYVDLLQEMKTLYSTAKICPYNTANFDRRLQELDDLQEVEDYDLNTFGDSSCLPTFSLEPELTSVMASSDDPRELRYTWRAWRGAAGAPLRPLYSRFVDLANEAARLNGYEDAGHSWRSDYEIGSLETDLDTLWEQLRPLYVQLHAYVRRKLRKHYGRVVPATGPIPAHLLGNMWAQDWSSILRHTLPYPDRAPYDVTSEMRRQGYTPLRIFRVADNFYRSLGLEPAPLSFWRDSLLVKPRNREVVCHASAWDMCNKQDYRVKMCTSITMEDLIKAHHEMGHIQYNLLYRNQPFIFRDGANPGFHEAIGDVIALSASTPRHMRALGLLPALALADIQHREQIDINHLFGVAVTKIAFLPFALVLDKWRWSVFRGDTNDSSLNADWWSLRMNYSGVSPPVLRTEQDFDPGAKYHVPANTPYVRYLVSFVLQFQLHEELCRAAGHTGDLHTCSIYGSLPAGDMLRRGLALGRSEPWPTVLSQLTGSTYNRLDAGPILRYFAPLQRWLVEQNQGEFLGWRESEALVAGKLSNAPLRAATTTAYAVVALFAGLILLIISCVLVHKCRKKNKPEEADAIPR